MFRLKNSAVIKTISEIANKLDIILNKKDNTLGNVNLVLDVPSDGAFLKVVGIYGVSVTIFVYVNNTVIDELILNKGCELRQIRGCIKSLYKVTGILK